MVGEKLTLKDNEDLAKDLPFYKKVDDFTCPSQETLIVSEYIRPYLTETNPAAMEKGVYQNRLQRSYPLTYTESVLQQHHSALSQSLVIKGFGRKSEEDPRTLADDIKDDVTGYGVTAKQMLSDQIMQRLKKGRHAILVEKDGASETLEQARANKERSYQTLYEAERIKELKYFTTGPMKGQIREIILVDGEQVKDDKRYKGGQRRNEKRRRYFYNGDEKSYTLQLLKSESHIEAGTTTIQKEKEWIVEDELVSEDPDRPIPVVVFGAGPVDSIARHIVDLDIALINRLSIWSNINYNQGFQRTILTGVKDGDGIGQIGEHLATTLPGANIDVKTIEPGNPESVEKEIRFLAKEIQRKGLFQYNQHSDDTKQIQGNESKQKDLQIRVNVYDNILDYLAPRIAMVYRLHAMFDAKGTENDIEVSISRDYGLVDTELELAEDALIWSWASEMGTEGFELKKQIIMRRAANMSFVATAEEDEDQVKQRIIDELSKASERKSNILPFRRSGDGVSNSGRLSLAEAVDADDAEAA